MGLFYPFGSNFRLKKDIYIGGMFNNYSMTPEYKMNYNVQKAIMKKLFWSNKDLQTTNTP
jgi:hypothetical protein